MWRRSLWIMLFCLMLAVNSFMLLGRISGNRNSLIYNPIVKAGLPFYRGLRELANAAIDSAYFFKMKRDVGIPQYRLVIDGEKLRKLNDALPSSLSSDVIAGNVLFNEDLKDTVSAKFYYNDKKYDVKVRYRGENANHWTRPKKSWQIKFDKDTPLNGLRTLKLIIPDDRGYFAEMLNNYRAEKMGLFFPRMEFAQFYVNNDYNGVYLAVEDFTGDFLESSQKPPEANIYVTDTAVINENKDATIFDNIDFWRKQAGDTMFDYANFSELDFLLKQLKSPDFAATAEDIIDMDSFYHWNIVAVLAGSNHQSDWGNMRLYFNNAKGKFEFIPWDVEIKSYLPTQLTNAITEKILANQDFYLERNRRLWNYVSDDKNLADDLRYYDELYNKVKPAFYSDLKKLDNNLTFNRRVAEIRSQYIILFNQLKSLFAEDHVKLQVRHDAGKKLLTLSFGVDSFAGINLDEIMLPGGAPLVSEVRHYLPNGNKTVEVHYGGNVIDDVSKVEYAMTNAVTRQSVKIDSIQISDITTFGTFFDISQTIDAFVKKHPMFKNLGNDIVLPAGSYVFGSDVVVPKNAVLRLEPGVNIALAEGVSLVSYSPVEARGTASRPIKLRSANAQAPWGSFAILNNGAKISTLEYVDAAGGGGDYINGTFTSGMVSIYYSDAVLSHIAIAESHSDDGMNLKYSHIDVANSLFHNNSADALDTDYVTGVIHDSAFTDNGNDGIDLSGSKVVIKNNRITGSGDKCISVGENTVDTYIFNTMMDGCHIGVQAKDGSRPVIINSVLVNNEIGVDAYRKKPIYITGGHPAVYNSIIRDNKEQIKQDEFSDIKVSFSNIGGGAAGESNFDEKKNYSDIQDRGRGQADILKQYLNIDAQEAPVGLWQAF